MTVEIISNEIWSEGVKIMDGERILIADSDARSVELAAIKLSNAGYWVITAANGAEAVEKLNGSPFDLVLINAALPPENGYQICKMIRNDPQKCSTAIILLVDANFDEAQFQQSGVRVEDLLVKPFSPKNLLSKVNATIIKERLQRGINPLTMLPGRSQIQERVNTKLAAGEKFNLLFIDLNGFRAYNLHYGFRQGDQVIQTMVKLFYDEIAKSGLHETELFHFGGDNFCIMTGVGQAADLAKNIISRFDQEIPTLYVEEDQGRGGLSFKNRRGVIEQWPIMTINLALVSNEKRKVSEWLEAEVIGNELIVYSQSMPGSQLASDRRRSKEKE